MRQDVSVLCLIEDVDLLQEHAVIQGHKRGLGQNLEDHSGLRTDEHHGVVLLGSCFVVDC